MRGTGSARWRRVLLGVVVALALIERPARADDAETQRARETFERGRELYYAAKYAEAIKAFEEGYAFVPRPLFLVNIAQSYHQLHDPVRSREYFRRFLETAPPEDPQRPSVEKLIVELDAEIAALTAAPPVVTAPQVDPHPIVVVPPVTLTRRQRALRFIEHRPWVVALGVVGLVGLSVGIYFAARPHGSAIDCTGASLGCVQ